MRNEKLRAELWKGVASEIRLVNTEIVKTAIVKVIVRVRDKAAGDPSVQPAANEAIDDVIAESQRLFH